MAVDEKAAKKKTVEIFVNNKPVELPDADTTGAEIKKAADIPAGFKLYNEKGKEIRNDQSLKVHKSQKFTAISGQDVS